MSLIHHDVIAEALRGMTADDWTELKKAADANGLDVASFIRYVTQATLKGEELSQNVASYGDFTLYDVLRICYVGGREVTLEGAEFDILYTLTCAKGATVARSVLAARAAIMPGSINTFMRRIRCKIWGNDWPTAHGTVIKSERNLGYRLVQRREPKEG